MPNRIIRESCRASISLDLLSAEAERLHWRLTTVADDFGRFLADPAAIRNDCWRLKAAPWPVRTVGKWLHELTAGGDPIVKLYEVAGKRYGYFVKWEHYQRPPRAKQSKYPAPTSDNMCKHLTTYAPGIRESLVVNREARVGAAHDPAAFARFWEAYPRKDNRVDAVAAWDRLRPDATLVQTVLAAVDRAKRSAQWVKDKGAFIPLPSTWLNKRRWEDALQPFDGKTDAVRKLEQELAGG